LFIMSRESKEVLVEKHWGNITERTACTNFWDEVAKLPNIKEMPMVLTFMDLYLFHFTQGGLVLLCCCAGETPPLLVVEFMSAICAILTDYFGDTKERTIRAHFVTVYQLLEEVCDSGMPLLTSPSVLKEIVPPPTILNRLNSTIQGTKGVVVSDQLPDCLASNVPWRRSNIKYTSNDILFDITEEVDATIDNQGRLVTAGVVGTVVCICSLSGMPDITVTFTNPSILDDARLHPCVRYARFAGDKSLSFVPPDGTFTLMQYRVKSGNQCSGASSGNATLNRGGHRGMPSLPIYVKPQINFSQGSGRVNIMVGPKADLGKSVEGIVVIFQLPPDTLHTDLTANVGTVHIDVANNRAKWEVGKLPKELTPVLSGSVRYHYDEHEGSNSLEPAPIVTVDFLVEGVTISGNSVDTLSLCNENYKPYKAVKLKTKAGLFEVRP